MNPEPDDWSAEEYATAGTTEQPPWVCVIGGAASAAVVYARSNDNGSPYFVTKTGAPSAVDLESPSAFPGRLDVFPSPAAGPVKMLFPAQDDASESASIPTGVVVDVTGRFVVRLAGWRPVGPSYESIWDGRDAGGSGVPAGGLLPQGGDSTGRALRSCNDRSLDQARGGTVISERRIERIQPHRDLELASCALIILQLPVVRTEEAECKSRRPAPVPSRKSSRQGGAVRPL